MQIENIYDNIINNTMTANGDIIFDIFFSQRFFLIYFVRIYYFTYICLT